MRRTPLPIAIVSLLSLAACLRIPPSPPRPDASTDAGDAGPPPEPDPPRIVAVDIVDHRGGAYSSAAIPRSPIVRVTLSEPPYDADASPPPMWLFAGTADDDLRNDLSDDPLRSATTARIIPSALDGNGTIWVLSASERLAPGTALTVGVGAWLRGATSTRKMGEPFAMEMRVSGAPEAGAAVTGSWPPDGAASVPTTIPSLAVRFDGLVEGVRDGLVLLAADGASVPGLARPTECSSAGWPDGFCAVFEPAQALAPASGYRFVVTDDVLDATGASIGPWTARFTTAADTTDAPPAFVALPCGLDEQTLDVGCVLADDSRIVLRMQASEPVRIALSIAGRTLLAVAPRGSATLAAHDLPPDTELDAVLRIADLADQVVETPSTLRTTEPLATLSIVEVRADPNGPEPRQEYVEVVNYGAVPMDLEGVSLSDRIDSIGDAVMRSQVLAPGQRALLVADEFDPDDPSDPPVPPAVPLVRMGRSLGAGGIANAGEPLFLRDAAMHRLSASPAIASGAGACLVRTGDDPRAGDASLFTSVDPCTPGLEPAP